MIFAKLALIFMAILCLSVPFIVVTAYSGNDSLGRFLIFIIFVSIISSVLAVLSAIAAAWVYFF